MRLTSPPSCAECHGNLNLLEPSGPYRACYGTSLPFLTSLKMTKNSRNMKKDTLPNNYNRIMLIFGYQLELNVCTDLFNEMFCAE